MTRTRLLLAALTGAWILVLAALFRRGSTTLAPPPSSPAVPPSPAVSSAPSASATAPTGAPITPEITTIPEDRSFQLQIFPIPIAGAGTRISVIDMGMSSDLAGALQRSGASLVVNGGFYDKSDRPEGLVISEGKTISARSDTLGGGVIAIAGGRATLSRAEGFVAAPDTVFAVQARPRLVASGDSVIVKDDGRTAPRTAICTRDGGRTIEVVIARGEEDATAGPTLALFADMLASRGCKDALNLDGGPSTGAAWRDADGAHVLAPRAPIRHAIAIWTSP